MLLPTLLTSLNTSLISATVTAIQILYIHTIGPNDMLRLMIQIDFETFHIFRVLTLHYMGGGSQNPPSRKTAITAIISDLRVAKLLDFSCIL